MQKMINQFSVKLLLIVSMLIFTCGIAISSARVALVIGNSKYQNASSLANPTNDADSMAKTLSEMGFEVSKIKDVGYTNLRLALRQFSSKAERADIALIFYAGHGMEVDKQNYLIPTDAKLASDRDIDFEAIPLDLLTQAAGGAKELSLVLLDACRNNPFAASMKRTIGTRSIGRGLAQVEPTAGTLVSFAAKEGTIANDGTGKNSPYTTALIKHLNQPGLEIQFLFRKVRDAVLQETNGGQEPFTYGSLPGKRIYLVHPDELKAAKISPNTNIALNKSTARDVYNDIKNSSDPEILDLFIKQFPGSIYAKFAIVKFKSLQKASLSPIKQLEKINTDSNTSFSEQSSGKVGFSKNSTPVKFSKYSRNINGYFQSWDSEARKYYYAKKYTEAAKIFRKFAADGRAHAVVNLGIMFQNGEGLPINYGEAARLYTSVASNSPSAMYNLAVLFDEGKGVKHDEYESAGLMYSALKRRFSYAVSEMVSNSEDWGAQFRSELQRKMKSDGYYHGAIDGSFGPATIRAIKKVAGH